MLVIVKDQRDDSERKWDTESEQLRCQEFAKVVECQSGGHTWKMGKAASD
jgi:hypothetical protein